MSIGKRLSRTNEVIRKNEQDRQFILMGRLEFYRWLMDQKFTRTIKLIQNHHTWIPNYSHFDGDNHFERVKAMDNYHENRRGWSDIGQNITTFPDGTICICRPINIIPAGIRGANSNGICIEHVGNFDIDGDEMTKEHKSTIEFVNAVLCLKFGLEVNDQTVVYHHWWTAKGKRTNGVNSAKSCPGTNFYGGNKVEDAKKNLYPRIIRQLTALKTM